MKPISQELIRKYLEGDCTPEEAQVVIEWYNSFEHAHDPYQDLSTVQQGDLKARMLSNIEAKNRRPARFFTFQRLLYLTAAAAVLLLVINYKSFLQDPLPFDALKVKSTELITIRNETNSIIKQVLPDQSIVWLSPGASIQYHKKFKNLRAIKLTGESFFEVTKDRQHPFIIYSDHITTKVWGTSFRVSDNSHSAHAEVAVLTGKVSVKMAHISSNEVMLSPRQRAIYHEDKPMLEIDTANKYSSLEIWKKTSLIFEKTTVQNVIQILNKEFNVRITLEDTTLNNLEMQADFDNQSLPDIMLILSKLLNRSYATDGKNFVFEK